MDTLLVQFQTEISSIPIYSNNPGKERVIVKALPQGREDRNESHLERND
jgi:hypothetical protein